MQLQGILKFTDHSNLYNNRRVKFRKAGSCNWSRRRAYWLQKSICRADYLACARRSKNLATQSFNAKGTHTIASVNHPTISKSVRIRDSVVQRKETSVRRRRLKRTELHRCRKVPSKPFPFYYTPKRIKKRMGFRRRCGTSVNVKVGSKREADVKSKIVRNAPKTNRKVRRPSSRNLPKPTSTPELKHSTAPKYHISYKKTLAVYKTMRKGSSFYPSRRVLWRNRHRVVLGDRLNKNSFCDDYRFSTKQDKEYFCPEPPEEDEDPLADGSVCDGKSQVCTGGLVSGSYEQSSTVTSVRESVEREAPQWLKMGGEYSSDNIKDGPDSSEEYDPEKDKATNRKRKQAKARKRWKRKRKQRDSEYRTSEFKERSRKRRSGEEQRNRKDVFQERSRKRRSGEE